MFFTLADLRIALASRLQISPCQLEIQGWTASPNDDRTTLASLQLPKESTLPVVTLTPDVILDQECTSAESSSTERVSQHFQLKVNDLTNSKDYSLKYPGSKTVLSVKTDVYTLTDIAVRHQVWTGWPEQLKSDRTTLARSGIGPVHEFTLRRNPTSARSTKERKVSIIIHSYS